MATPDINKILALPCNKGYSERGASMGRWSQTEGKPECLYLQRMRFVDGAYDTGGAYWGGGNPMWCAFSPDTTDNEFTIRVFTRAANREEAKANVLATLVGEGWGFLR